MALKKVEFVLGEGGLSRELPNQDHISALCFDFAGPSAFTTARMQSFRSIGQVEAQGIDAQGIYADVWYHASEFWRINPNGKLWLIFEFNTQSASAIVAQTSGEIRQYAVIRNHSLANVNALQTLMNQLQTLDAPAVCVMGSGGILDLGSVSGSDRPRNQSNPNVMCLVAGDGSNNGAALAGALGLPCLIAIGAVLGAISLSAVHESIAWVAKFNFAKTELENPIFVDGVLLANVSASDLDDYDDMGFVFFRKFVGRAGSYINQSHAATDLQSDYAYLENSRTIQKAIRGMRANLLPQLSSPLYAQADGTLRPDTIGFFKSKTSTALVQMENDGELSAFSVEIDPIQNVVSTGLLEIVTKILPVGVAREIIVKLGFTAAIA